MSIPNVLDSITAIAVNVLMWLCGNSATQAHSKPLPSIQKWERGTEASLALALCVSHKRDIECASGDSSQSTEGAERRQRAGKILLIADWD